MLIGTNQDKMEHIIRDLKRHTSEKLRSAITNNYAESRKECLPADTGGDVGYDDKGRDGQAQVRQAKAEPHTFARPIIILIFSFGNRIIIR